MMKQIWSFFAVVLISMTAVMAQSIPDGVKLLNYEKNASAQALFQKLYDANSKDPQTIYWLGQAMIANDNISGAQALYQKALTDGVNDPWIWVGSGHIDILQGKDINVAKQKFEQAITATTETKGRNKGKPSAAILTAIGRANAVGRDAEGVSIKLGDPVYAIDKLKQAAAIDPTNPDIFINMGILYQKLGGEQGGDAVKAYQEAIAHDPKNARAMYRIGRVYQSQNNKESLEKYYNDAIAADPSFSPAYYALYQYYADKDVNRAKDYLDNFLKYADKDPKNDLYYADYLFRAGRYNESLAKAKEIEASVGLAKVPMLNIIYAYDYDRLGDSVQAKNYVDKFFATATPDIIKPEHYVLAVKIYSKFPGNEATAAKYLDVAISNDSIATDKINYINQALDMFRKAKDYKSEITWYGRLATLKKDLSLTDYFYLTDAEIQVKDTTAAIQHSLALIQKFPDQPYGYRDLVLAKLQEDLDTTTGAAIPAMQQYIDFMAKDSVKNARFMKGYYFYMATFYSDKQKDYAKALEMINHILWLDPNEPSAKNAKEALEKALSRPARPAGKGTAAESATSNKSSGAPPPKK